MTKPKKNKKISRKEFLQRTAMGAIGAGLLSGPASAATSKYTSPQTRLLGSSGIEVTRLAFGASRTQEPAMVRAALDRGITFIDTGRSYANGQNEVMLGKVLKGMRHKLVIQSKMRIRISQGGKSLSEKEIRSQMEDSLEATLKALQTDYVDIMLIHGASDHAVIQHEAVRENFEKMKKNGQIKLAGFSSHTNQVELLQTHNEDPFYEVIMVPINPFGKFVHSNNGREDSWDFPAQTEAMERAHKQGTILLAMKTTSGGPYAFSTDEKPTYPNTIKWVLQQDYVTAAAVAMANYSQMDEDCSLL
jgi:aryl-alcohol dehydrogenase-like predicted oxidoreductase